jgi:hypothetical protein
MLSSVAIVGAMILDLSSHQMRTRDAPINATLRSTSENAIETDIWTVAALMRKFVNAIS